MISDSTPRDIGNLCGNSENDDEAHQRRRQIATLYFSISYRQMVMLQMEYEDRYYGIDLQNDDEAHQRRRHIATLYCSISYRQMVMLQMEYEDRYYGIDLGLR
jgi:hypothetical protein